MNKQYTKEEYETLVPKIIKHMQKTGEWGQFFPPSISPFHYNETSAQDFLPLKKEEVLSMGWKWREDDPHEYKSQSFITPDNISDFTDEMTKEILACNKCGKNYRIIPHELNFYRNLGLPVPRKCHDCRHKERLALRNPSHIYDRRCANCSAEIRTTYSPDQPEKVYCEACYLKTVY